MWVSETRFTLFITYPARELRELECGFPKLEFPKLELLLTYPADS
jgi:hypothetical protein